MSELTHYLATHVPILTAYSQHPGVEVRFEGELYRWPAVTEGRKYPRLFDLDSSSIERGPWHQFPPARPVPFPCMKSGSSYSKSTGEVARVEIR